MSVIHNVTSFSSEVSDNVDRENGVIKNILLARVGEVKGHGVYADKVFTKSIVDSGKQYPQGVKARFGHPNASNTTLGTYIGRYKNFKYKEGNAYADLHLDEVAKISPRGDLYSYVLEMAENNPDQFGNSIVFRTNPVETKELTIDSEEFNSDYEEIIEEKKDGKLKVKRYLTRLKVLLASDLVDEGAATDSLFSEFENEEDFAFIATNFLDENPKLFKLLNDNPDVLDGFLVKYEAYKERNQLNNNKSNLMEEEKKEVSKIDALIEGMASFFNKRAEVEEAKEEAVKTFSQEDLDAVVNSAKENAESLLNSHKEEMSQKDEEIKNLQAELEKLNNKQTEAKGENNSPEAEVVEEKESAFMNKTLSRIKNKFL